MKRQPAGGLTRLGGSPGGTYTLRIIDSNQDGLWNNEGIRVNVTVIPPFWQTT